MSSNCDAPSKHTCKQKEINVASVKKTSTDKTIRCFSFRNFFYVNRNACSFCSKEVTKIGRHIPSVHKHETKVSEILGSSLVEKKKRKTIIAVIRQKGNFYNNVKSLKIGGEIKVVRRPTDSMHDS